MRGEENKPAGRMKGRGYRVRNPFRRGDTAKLAAGLAPLEERKTPRPGGNGASAGHTIRVDAEALKSKGGVLDEGEREPGVFHMPPVVIAAFGLLIAYAIFVAVLIALG